MAQNKNAQIRYKALDKCFANRYKKFYISDLIAYCSDILSDHYGEEMTISRRQILMDIDFLKSDAGYEAPIESYQDGKKVYYRYSDQDFSILKMPLSPAELNSLEEALETLSRMKNIPGGDWVNSIQTKLNSGLRKTEDQRQVISFEENEFLKGIEFLNPLYHFIINRQMLEINYKSFLLDDDRIFTVSPYFLKQYNNRWFLFAWNHREGFIQNLALDRIQKIEVGTGKFIDNHTHFEEYFEDIIGVSNDLTKDVVKIKIKLSDNILPYINSKPIHGSQHVKKNIISLQLRLNYELESTILFYGENMTVLEPPELVDRIKRRLEDMNKNYECTSTAQ